MIIVLIILINNCLKLLLLKKKNPIIRKNIVTPSTKKPPIIVLLTSISCNGNKSGKSYNFTCVPITITQAMILRNSTPTSRFRFTNFIFSLILLSMILYYKNSLLSKNFYILVYFFISSICSIIL